MGALAAVYGPQGYNLGWNLGRIAGAGLDVFPEELFPVSEPVLLLDNVVLSPHLAGAGREARIRQNLQRILQCSACRPR